MEIGSTASIAAFPDFPTTGSSSANAGQAGTPSFTRTRVSSLEDLSDAVYGAGLQVMQLSRQPVTGSLYFVPTATFLDDVTTEAPAAAETTEPEPPLPAPSPAPAAVSDTSLRIGSLKGEKDE